MSYTHLTPDDRYCIYHQQMARFSAAEIGRRIKRHRGTIARKLKRFHQHPSWPCCHQYFPDGADQLAKERRRAKRGFRWIRHRPQPPAKALAPNAINYPGNSPPPFSRFTPNSSKSMAQKR